MGPAGGKCSAPRLEAGATCSPPSDPFSLYESICRTGNCKVGEGCPRSGTTLQLAPAKPSRGSRFTCLEAVEHRTSTPHSCAPTSFGLALNLDQLVRAPCVHDVMPACMHEPLCHVAVEQLLRIHGGRRVRQLRRQREHPAALGLLTNPGRIACGRRACVVVACRR